MSPEEPVRFELERCEVVDGRLELAGHWSGVRGLRFVRPTLVVDDQRVLADLEHKPWQPTDGEPWTAAFPWKADAIDPRAARLAVAPTVVVPLDGDASAPPRARGDEVALMREELDAERQRLRRQETEIAFLRQERAAMIGRDEAASELERAEAARRAVECERGEALAELHVAERRLNEVARKLESVSRERDRVASERDEALAARDLADRDLEAVAAELAAVRDERDAAIAELRAVPMGVEVVSAAERPPARDARRAALASWVEHRALRDRVAVKRPGWEGWPGEPRVFPALALAAALCLVLAVLAILGAF